MCKTEFDDWDEIDNLWLEVMLEVADEKRNSRTTFNEYKSRPAVRGQVYILRSNSTGLHKIGCTRNLKRRMREFKTGSPEPLVLVASCYSKDMYESEKILHEKYHAYRIRGEWFELTPYALADAKAMLDFPKYYQSFMAFLDDKWGERPVPIEWIDTDTEAKMYQIALGIIPSEDDDLVRDCRNMLGWEDDDVYKGLNCSE